MQKNCLHRRIRKCLVGVGLRLYISTPLAMQLLRFVARSILLGLLYHGRNPALHEKKILSTDLSLCPLVKSNTHPLSTDWSPSIFWVTLTTKQVSWGSSSGATTCFRSFRPKLVKASNQPTPLFPHVQYLDFLIVLPDSFLPRHRTVTSWGLTRHR